MMSVLFKELPRLMKLRQSHSLTSQELADAAGVTLREEYLMEIGAMVKKEDACKIMHALSILTSKTYTLDDVDVTLRPEDLSFETLPAVPQQEKES